MTYREGPPRYFVPVVARMPLQQIPAFAYVETTREEAERVCPIVVEAEEEDEPKLR